MVKREGGSTLGGLAVDPTFLGSERACPPHPPRPLPRTNLVRSAGLSSTGGQSLAREGHGLWSPRQDNSADTQGGGSEGTPTYKKELVGEVEVAGAGKEGGGVCVISQD